MSLLIILISIQTLVAYKLHNDVIFNTEQIKNIEIPLQLSVQKILSYDSILTVDADASLIHAQKGDYTKTPYHKTRYDEYEVKLDNLLKNDIEVLLAQSKIEQENKDKIIALIAARREIKMERVDIEKKTFQAIEQKDINTAYNLLSSDKYDALKDTLYKNWGDIVSELPSDSISKSATDKSQQDLYFNLIVSILNGIIIIIIFKTRNLF